MTDKQKHLQQMFGNKHLPRSAVKDLGIELPKTGKDLGIPKENPFHDAEIVTSYTEDDAVEDGFLVDLTKQALAHGLKVGRCLVSRGIFHDILIDKGTKAAGPVIDEAGDCEVDVDISKPLLELFKALAVAQAAAGPEENEYWWFKHAEKEIKAGFMGGRLTLCYPEED
jgi:hypothetical protein